MTPWFLRMALWVRRPPSPGRVALVAGVVAACLVLAAIEHYVGFPDLFDRRALPKGRISFP
jgi:hypothetical protein